MATLTILRTGHYVLLLKFIAFLPPNLRGPLAVRHQTLPHVRWWPRFIKFGQKFGAPSPKFRGPKFWCNFGQLCNLITHISGAQQDIVNRKTALQSRTLKLNLTYFDPQTAKNRTGLLIHPPATVQRTGINKSVAFARGQHAHCMGGHHAVATHLVVSYCTFAECDKAGAMTDEFWGSTSAGAFASTTFGFTTAVVGTLVSAAAFSFNRLTETLLGFTVTLSGVDDDTGTTVVVPLATARRVALSGVNRDDGRDGVNFNFLPAGCARFSYDQSTQLT